MASRSTAIPDQDTDQKVAALRREVSAGLAARDLKRVESCQNKIIALFPESAKLRLELVEFALKLGETFRAADHFDIFLRSELDDSVDPISLLKARVRINLRLGRIADAAAAASEWSDGFGGELQNALYAMRAFARNNDKARFLKAARAVRELAHDLTSVRPELAHTYNNLGYSRRALKLFADASISGISSVPDLLEWGRASLGAEYVGQAGLSALERAMEIEPGNARVRQYLSMAWSRMGQPRKALELIGDTEAETDSESTRASRAEILLETGRYQEAISSFEKLVEAHPRHRGWRRALVGSYVLSGDLASADAAYKKDLELRRIPSGTPFQSCLEDIELELSTAAIPAYRFEWAYQRLKNLGAVPADRSDWEDACRWVHLADHLTLNWLETRSESVDELTSLISGTRDAKDELHHATVNGYGGFLATVHVGALFAGPLALAESGFDYRWVASTPLVSSVPGSEKLLSTYSLNRLQMARECYRAVRSGAIVSLAVDGAIGPTSRVVPFAGDELLLSDYVPRAVYQTGAVSFFPKTAWRNRKVEVELVRLPMPGPTETADVFVNRWLEAFAQALERFFKTDSDNLRLSGGFWSHIRL